MRDIENFNYQELIDVLKGLSGEIVYIKYYNNHNSTEPRYGYFVVSKVAEDGANSRLCVISPSGNFLLKEEMLLINIEYIAKSHLVYRESEPFFYYGYDHDVMSHMANKRK